MPAIVLLVAAWGLSFIVNLAPAFMPPTWSVLAAFHILRPELPLLALTVGGAAMSTVGRTGLALLSRKVVGELPARDQENAAALGTFLTHHRRWSLFIIFGYCLGPLPSNALFIAAGVAQIRLRAVAATFFVSRAIADTFWVWTAGRASGSLADVFERTLTSWQGIALQLLGIAVVVLLLRLPWADWLRPRNRRANRAG